MDSSFLHRVFFSLHHFSCSFVEKIYRYLNSFKTVFQRSILANNGAFATSISVLSDVEKNVQRSSHSIGDGCSASEVLVAPENVVAWTLFTGQYDVDKSILIDACNPSRFVTKRKALELVTRLAEAFEPDSTVGLHLLNDVLYPVLILGILAAKCRWTGTNTAYTSFELDHHFRKSVTKYVITLPEHGRTVEAATKELAWDIEIVLFTDILSNDSLLEDPHEDPASESTAKRTLHDLLTNSDEWNLEANIHSIRPDHIAALQSTSGTTGLPKMAVRTHRALILESKAIEDNNAAKPYEVRRLFCTPIFHAFSTPEMLITPLRLGIPTYIMRRYDDTFAQKIYDFGITETAAPPPMLKMLQKQGQHHLLQSIRMILCGGAPLIPELRNRVLSMFEKAPRIVQVWGMTEGGWLSTFKYPEDDATGSVGRVVPGVQIKMSQHHVLDMSDGRKAAELLIRGPQLMTEYFGDKQASKDAFVQGWLKTGDVGHIRDGNIYTVDRCKDLIKVNGWQVAPAEIEAALELPGVADAAAIAAGYGVDEHPLLFVVRSHGTDVSKEEIVNHLRSRIAKHKVARIVVEFIDSIPRNTSGKILRGLLRVEGRKRGMIDGN